MAGSDRSEIRIAKDADEWGRQAADLTIEKMNENLKMKATFAIALSGGSTPRRLYAVLATMPYRVKVPWDRVHFFWGDERHVPPDHPESNYRMAYEAMLSKAPVPPENIHRIRAEYPDAEKAAEDYEQELIRAFGLEQGELPEFDCVLLGMGQDGHTASLFPATEALEEQGRLVVANWVEEFSSHRITLPAPVLNNADLVLFLVKGEEKADTLKAVLEGEERPKKLPSQLIKPAHGRLIWLVDEAAASRLGTKG
jgi:6-phosphogluconolactonase